MKKYLIMTLCIMILGGCTKINKFNLYEEDKSSYESMHSNINDSDIEIIYSEERLPYEYNDLEIENYGISGFSKEQLNVSDSEMNINLADLYYDVLNNKKPLYFTDKTITNDAYTIHENETLLSELDYGYDGRCNIDSFAIFDINEDSIPEVLLRVSNYFGYIILHPRYNNSIVGIGITSPEFCDPKTDGTFLSTAGASFGSINKLFFINDTVVYVMIASRENENYYIEDLECEEADWNGIYEHYLSVDDLEWHVFSEENVKQQIYNNLQLNIQYEHMYESTTKKQSFMDSLNFIVEQRYKLRAESETYTKDAIEYFYNNSKKMEELLIMVKEGMSDADIVALEMEQENWREGYQDRINKILNQYHITDLEDLLEFDYRYEYVKLADIQFRRILFLIDRYL